MTNEYMRAYLRRYRAEHPEYRARQSQQRVIYEKALRRLRDLHPGKFKMLLAEEKAKAGRAEPEA